MVCSKRILPQHPWQNELWLGWVVWCKGGRGLSGFCELEEGSWELGLGLHLGLDLDEEHHVQDQCDWDWNCLPHLMRLHQDQEEVESAGIFWCLTTWSRPGCRTCARQSWWGLELPTRILRWLEDNMIKATTWLHDPSFGALPEPSWGIFKATLIWFS